MSGAVPEASFHYSVARSRWSGDPPTSLAFVSQCGVQTARNCPSADRKCWQRVRLGIHGMNRWTVKCREMSRKHGVRTDKTPRARTEVLAAPCVKYPLHEHMTRRLSRHFWKTRRPNRQNAPSEDRSVVSAFKGIEARRPPLPGARWPSRRLPEAEGPPGLWHPGNLVGPQRPPGHYSPTPRPTPDQRGQVVRGPSPAGYCLLSTGRVAGRYCYPAIKYGVPGTARRAPLPYSALILAASLFLLPGLTPAPFGLTPVPLSLSRAHLGVDI